MPVFGKKGHKFFIAKRFSNTNKLIILQEALKLTILL